MTERPVDLPDVLDRVQDDRELLFELFDIFQNDFKGKYKFLLELLQQQRAGEIRDLAHSLKGAAGNISARALFATCLRMEKNADQGNLAAVSSEMGLLEQQFAEFQEFVTAVKANPGKFFAL